MWTCTSTTIFTANKHQTFRAHPKSKIKLPLTKREAGLFRHFIKPGETRWNWSGVIYDSHPKLKEMIESGGGGHIYKQCHEYAKEFIDKNKNKLKGTVRQFQKDWDKIGDKYLKILSRHFETDYPKNRKIITAYVSIVPIYPRYLDRWLFNVGFLGKNRMKQIAMHEILHFLYFKKWLEIFPKTKRKELDSPHLVWKLSEILDPIILNNQPDIQRILKTKTYTYKEFQNVKIGGKKIPEYYKNLYLRHLKGGKTFEKFLRTAWSKTLKHKNIIENV